MFLTIKRSNISERLTPLIMLSGCPYRGTALPCPDGCREAMPEAAKSHFLKGGLSACKRYPFGLQKTTFCEPKDGLLESTEKQSFATAAVCRRKMRPRFRQKYLTAKKKKQHKPRQHQPAATKHNTAGEKGGSTDEKARQREKSQKRQKNAAGGKTMRQRSRKTRHPQRHASHI